MAIMKLPLDSKAIDPKEISAIPAAFRMARHFSADVTVENRPLLQCRRCQLLFFTFFPHYCIHSEMSAISLW
jgi:hypothetical protein